MWQAFAPLTLSRWQMTKLFAVQMNQDYPVVAKLGLIFFLSAVFSIVSFLTRPRRLEKKLRLPVISGSRTLEKDFVAVIERGRQMVSTRNLLPTRMQAYIHANRVRPHLVAPRPALYRQLVRPPVRRLSTQEL